jgi:hypothetical protein
MPTFRCDEKSSFYTVKLKWIWYINEAEDDQGPPERDAKRKRPAHVCACRRAAAFALPGWSWMRAVLVLSLRRPRPCPAGCGLYVCRLRSGLLRVPTPSAIAHSTTQQLLRVKKQRLDAECFAASASDCCTSHVFRTCLVPKKNLQNFLRFSVTLNLYTHAWSIKYR